ncbi:MAG: NADAR family protein [Myxococcales bacterium]|nr:NADAR family protein [Myxococcales bacterium]MCB9754102.1 NADAR family protein [Myxococcales bacterium]
MPDWLTTLPSRLPAGEPYVYLSAAQAPVIAAKLPALADAVGRLPCWAPHRRVADALGYGHAGIEHALRWTGGRPYVWATELENVHSLWRYDEPELEIDGVRYRDSEDYFHAQKPRPFVAREWDARRVGVMRIALRHKLAARPQLAELLAATDPHPLLALKPDAFWGVPPSGQGENMLARLWEELRGGSRLS